jgi:hypothetical protein
MERDRPPHTTEDSQMTPDWISRSRTVMARRSGGTLRIMTASELDAAALRPPQKERACLAERLLESLEILSSEERDELWAAEALRRDAEMDAVAGQVRDNDSVFASHGLGGRDEARLARPCGGVE